MSSSRRGAPPQAEEGESLLSKAFGSWPSGLALALLVTLALSARWMHIASHIYESRVILRSDVAGAEGARKQLDPQQLEQQLLGALEHPLDAAEAAVPVESVAIRKLPAGELILLCRADSPEQAQQHCRVAARVLQRSNGVRGARDASRAYYPLEQSLEAPGVVLPFSLAIGVACSIAWMLGRALMPQLPVPRPSQAPRPSSRPRPSSATPTRITMVSSADDARRAGGASYEKHSASTSLAMVGDQDVGNVIPLPVSDGWQMDAELTQVEASTDMARLRDELCLAASQSCFVVGVASSPEHTDLKSRLAVQLAWLLANLEGPRVLLVEADFADPNLEDLLQLDTPPFSGFSQQIQAHLRDGRMAPWVVARCASNLCVLAEGRLRTPGVLYSSGFPAAISQLRHHFDLIVIDGPTIGRDVDARAFDDVTDGIVFANPASSKPDQALATAKKWVRSKRLLASASVR